MSKDEQLYQAISKIGITTIDELLDARQILRRVYYESLSPEQQRKVTLAHTVLPHRE